MRKKYERSYRAIKKNFPQILLSLVFLMGIILGSLFANSLDFTLDKGAMELSKLLDSFIRNINFKELSDSYLLGRSFINYIKQVIFIWLFGLTNFTIVIVLLIIGIQGFSYGFTSSFFVIKYGLKGLLLSIVAYGVQGVIFTYLIYSLALAAIRFARKDVRAKPKIYFIYLLTSTIGVCIISLYETYLMPIIIQYTIERFF